MNKHNNVYFILFGNDRYRPDAHLKSCRDHFDRLPDARRYASKFRNAYIFKAHYSSAGDLEYIEEINQF